jgi:hypothetical protein
MMSESALTKYFDLPPGKWRINSSVPGFKVVGVAIVDLRRRLFPLRQVELSEFAKQVPFDEKGEPIAPPVLRRGLPTLYYYFSQSIYLLPVPLHGWRLKVDYARREESRTRNALGEFTGALTGPKGV